jgi:hypothetical protein
VPASPSRDKGKSLIDYLPRKRNHSDPNSNPSSSNNIQSERYIYHHPQLNSNFSDLNQGIISNDTFKRQKSLSTNTYLNTQLNTEFTDHLQRFRENEPAIRHVKCPGCGAFHSLTSDHTDYCKRCVDRLNEPTYTCNKCDIALSSKWYTDQFKPGKICKSCYTKRRNSASFDGIEGIRKCSVCETTVTVRWYQNTYKTRLFICKACHEHRRVNKGHKKD